MSLIININDAIKMFDYVKSRDSGIFHENNERCLIHDSHESYKNSAEVSFPSMALNVSLIIIIIKKEERKEIER